MARYSYGKKVSKDTNGKYCQSVKRRDVCGNIYESANMIVMFAILQAF